MEEAVVVEMSEEELRAMREAKVARLEAFARSLSRKRREAVAARQNNGLENDWREDEESYAGIDEINRDNKGMLKPSTIGGSFVGTGGGTTRSTVFLNITRPYVDAAAARIADMLLPTDDRNWSLKPTPVPELNKFKNDMTPMKAPNGMPMADPQGKPVAVKDHVRALNDEARRRAELAQTRIDDWLVQCQFNSEVRKVIEDSARIGVGILKGPFPKKGVKKSFEKSGGYAAMKIEERIDPASRRIDPWNFFPAADCGENIQECSGVWERDLISYRKLAELRQIRGYLADQIELCLEEGPQGKFSDATGRRSENINEDKEMFEIWYYHGSADKDDLVAAGLPEEAAFSGSVILTLVNDRVIKAALSPLDSGEYPYDVYTWQRREGSWAGVGVSRQIRTPQRMINACTRNMMDNAGLSSGPQIIVNREAVTPADGSYSLVPRKVWYATDIDGKGVNSAFLAVNIPTLQNELMGIIQYAQKMAEDVTGLPQIMQGQMGNAPETVGGMTMLNNNASTVLRRLARQFDDMITRPHIRRYYEWLMLYGENDEEKGDYKIDARGSTSLIERDIQMQAIVQMGQLVQNPMNPFKIDPARWFLEMSKAQKIDAFKFQYSDDEWTKLQEQAAQHPQVDPRVQVAQIKGQVDQAVAQLRQQTEQVRIQRDTDRDTVYVQAEAERTRAEHDARMQELMVKRELAMLEYANKREMKLEDVKAKLADSAMRLRVQKELAAADRAVQVAEPAVEPNGRAPNGRAFTE